MATQIEIAKLALQHIGDRYEIASLSEDSVEAEQVNLVYDHVRQEALRMHPWRFATKWANPAALSVTVPANWTYAYQYPSDAVYIQFIENPLGRDKVWIEFETGLLADDTRVILTDEFEPEIRYTSDVTDESLFDTQFVNCFSFLLASRVALALTGDGGIKQALLEEAFSYVQAAAASDSNEGRKQRAPDASWITARN